MTLDSGALTPEQVANASFDSKRRGYDPAAVDAHLKAAARTVTNLEGEVVALAQKVDALTNEVASAQKAAAVAAKDPIELDEDALADRIGQDAARVLAEARSAAADRLVEAEKEAEQILVRAEQVYASRSQEADDEAERIRLRAGRDAEARAQEAEEAAAQLMSSAEADLELVRSEVSLDRESADAEANQIVREAEVARRQILGDLLRRRGAAKRQIEQLRAGRERLLASHETVRRALDEITEELAISMSEARAAASTAGHSVSDGTIEELEAEIETARLTGLLDTGPVPVVRSPALPTSSSANRPPAESSPPKEDPNGGTAADPTGRAEEAAEEVAEEVAEDPAVEVADSMEVSGDLADVVQLDQARSEVDTKSHPAKGRDASNGRANGNSTPSETADAESADAVANDEDIAPTKLVAAPDPEPALDDSLGDLFASLRSENDEPVPAAKKKSTAKKKPPASTSKKKAKSTKASTSALGSTTAIKTNDPAPVVDAAALARRLKRVLADEQSRAMSTIKNADALPDLDGLLSTEPDHRSSYWSEVLDQLDDPLLAGPEASQAIDSLVKTIRRRVDDALTSADGDGEAAVGSLRSIYREIKTQLIGETAEEVSHSMLAKS